MQIELSNRSQFVTYEVDIKYKFFVKNQETGSLKHYF